MHIMVAELSAHYSGRGETELSPYNRIVILKADGTVSIHGDKGFKPMNYMSTSSIMTEAIDDEGLRTWTFETKKEKLVIRFHQVYNEINLELGTEDPGHSNKDGGEKQLQEWLTYKLEELDPTLKFVEREYQTGAGPVDIFATRDDGRTLVAVEVKKLAPMNTVGQVLRYVDAIEEQFPESRVIGLIAATDFKDKTLEIAAKKGVECLQIPPNWLDAFHVDSIAKALPPPRSLFD